MSEKSFNTSFFSLINLYCKLECINSRMFLPLYSIKRMRNIYRGVTQCYHLQFSCFGVQSIEFCYQPLVNWSEYCVLMHCRCTYWLQMWTKMQPSVFKMSNNKENVINLKCTMSHFDPHLKSTNKFDCIKMNYSDQYSISFHITSPFRGLTWSKNVKVM